MTDTQITKRQPMELDEKGLALKTQDDLWRFAEYIVSSGLCPKAYANKPKDALIAMVAGRGVGLNPLQALRGIAVIGGKPSMYGEDRTAVCLSRGQVEWTREWFELDGVPITPEQYANMATIPDGLVACWESKRKDQTAPTSTVRFGVRDAKRANLWGKSGPWQQYPLRMLQMRARAYGERDNYADALAGIEQREEIEDIPRRERDPLEDVLDLEPEAEDVEHEPVTEREQQDALKPETPAELPAREPERDPETGEEIPDWVGRGQEEGADAAKEPVELPDPE